AQHDLRSRQRNTGTHTTTGPQRSRGRKVERALPQSHPLLGRAMTAQLCPDWGSEFASTYAPELDGPLPLSRRVWSAAALGALLLHLSGAALTYRYLQPENSDDLGAPAIAIGVDIVSPRRDAEDLPV